MERASRNFVKTSKGCVTDHDQNIVIDSNDADELIDDESDEADNFNFARVSTYQQDKWNYPL